jgi:hypothetical protein
MAPRARFELATLRLALIEGNLQVATKSDESLSPSLFTIRSYFATIDRYYYYDFTTARGGRLPWAQEVPSSNLGAPTKISRMFSLG